MVLKRGTIIGLAGAKGVGKTTVAQEIADRYVDPVEILSFASPLKKMLVAMGIPNRNVHDPKFKDEPINWIGKSARELMQSLGTEWARNQISDDIWLRSMESRMSVFNINVPIVIDDVRFDNEVDYIKSIDGKIVLLEREGYEFTMEHITEMGVSSYDYKVDANNINNAVDFILTNCH